MPINFSEEDRKYNNKIIPPFKNDIYQIDFLVIGCINSKGCKAEGNLKNNAFLGVYFKPFNFIIRRTIMAVSS